MAAAESGPPVRVEVLGPLGLAVDEAPVDIRGPKRRGALALLAVAEGRAVTVDHLLDALWPGEVPGSGRAALHSHVSRLRGHLGAAADRLETLDGAYRLALYEGELDAADARRLLETARARAQPDPAGACTLLREARALWQGPALADLTDVAPLASTAVVLAQLHREITDLLVSCALAAGVADEAVAIAIEALAAEPLREPAVLQAMRALATAGRVPDALRTGREYREGLVDQTGLDPSTALAELERDLARGTATPTPAPAASRRVVPARSVTPLIGRNAQVAALQRLLDSERLVTMVGPGGVGKTRVALEAARRAGATAVLLLAPVTAATAIPHALAAALDLQVTTSDVLAACSALLAAEPNVLVVDNCEHLLDAVRDTISTLLGDCPDLTVLATSREPLGLACECTTRLAPLPLASAEQVRSDHADGLARVPSIAVFLDRATRVRPGFTTDAGALRRVADIVRRLDGMPLAIELAAGRLSSFSLDDLAARIDRSLDLLGGGVPTADSRHRTLRATISWSYDLLSASEQRLFRHLSVFTDGFDLETAEFVAADLSMAGDPASALARLVDASMVEATFDGPTRYRMLETLRAFGLDQLAATGEHDAAAARLVRWAVDLTRWIGTTITSEREPDADAALRRELSNLRTAWHLTRQQERLDDAALLVVTLSSVSNWRDLTEIRGWADELAGDDRLVGHPHAAAVLGSAANISYMRGDHARTERLARAGLQLSDDRSGRWHCLTALSLAALGRGDHTGVVEHAVAAAALTSEPSENFGVAALGATYSGDLDRARGLHHRMVAAARSPTLRAFSAYVGAEVDSASGHAERAEEQYRRAIEDARAAGATFVVGIASVGLQSRRAAAGRVVEALRGYRELVDYWSRTGNWNHQWTTLRNLADLLRQLDDPEPAALLDAAADQAPDAPAMAPRATGVAVVPRSPVPNRAQVLEIARRAIDHLARRHAGPTR